MKKILSILLIVSLISCFCSCNEILGIPDEDASDKGTENNAPENEDTSDGENDNGPNIIRPGENDSLTGDLDNPLAPPSLDDSSNDDSNNTQQPDRIIVQQYKIKDIYKTYPQFKSDTPIDSFTDGESNYFFFKIGEIARVPIAYSSTVFYQGIGTRVLKFSSTESIETTISNAVENCLSATVTAGVEIDVGLGAGEENDGNAFIAGALLQSELSASLSASTSRTLAQSVSNTFSKCSEDIFELDPSCPEGCYRYTIYANCEIYLSIEADLETQTFDYTYLCFVKNDTKIEGWIYSEDGYYETPETIYQEMEKLSVTKEILESIDLYGKLDTFKKFKGTTRYFSSKAPLEEDYYYYYWINVNQCDLDIDLVEKKFAVSSTSSVRYNLLDNIEDMFKIVKEEVNGKDF